MTLDLPCRVCLGPFDAELVQRILAAGGPDVSACRGLRWVPRPGIDKTPIFDVLWREASRVARVLGFEGSTITGRGVQPCAVVRVDEGLHVVPIDGIDLGPGPERVTGGIDVDAWFEAQSERLRRAVLRAETEQFQRMLGEAADAAGKPGAPSWPEVLAAISDLREHRDAIAFAPKGEGVSRALYADLLAELGPGVTASWAIRRARALLRRESLLVDVERYMRAPPAHSEDEARARWDALRDRVVAEVRRPCGHGLDRWGCTPERCGYGEFDERAR